MGFGIIFQKYKWETFSSVYYGGMINLIIFISKLNLALGSLVSYDICKSKTYKNISLLLHIKIFQLNYFTFLLRVF